MKVDSMSYFWLSDITESLNKFDIVLSLKYTGFIKHEKMVGTQKAWLCEMLAL